MCGRVTVKTSAEQLALEFQLSLVLAKLDRPRFNVPPTAMLPVVANTGRRELDLYKWGLVPAWAKDVSIGNKLTNARADTIAEKPSFKTALKKRRCLILVDGFYEWKRDGKTKKPFLFRRKDEKPFALAGLWEEWKSRDLPEVLRTCTIITTEANSLMSPVHDRMPVILPPEAQELWLKPEALEPAQLAPVLVPCPPESLERFEVGVIVNNARNDVPECVVPVGPG
jgi:putative SOS response-associated peptidase YedK